MPFARLPLLVVEQPLGVAQPFAVAVLQLPAAVARLLAAAASSPLAEQLELVVAAEPPAAAIGLLAVDAAIVVAAAAAVVDVIAPLAPVLVVPAVVVAEIKIQAVIC